VPLDGDFTGDACVDFGLQPGQAVPGVDPEEDTEKKKSCRSRQ
jgi:hypothetical protein